MYNMYKSMTTKQLYVSYMFIVQSITNKVDKNSIQNENCFTVDPLDVVCMDVTVVG